MILVRGDIHIDIPIQIKKADTFVSRFVGLMGRKSLPIYEGLHIIPCNSIHMFFMRFPIDVVFLDKNNQVVRTVENLQPWRVVPTVKHAYSTLELPVGTIAEYQINIGDRFLL